ncbi:MAG: type 1 glutamine amidotransferase [Nakamurella sp.]
MTRTPHQIPRILVLEHDPSDPLLRLGGWLAEAGATVDVCRAHAGDPIPTDTSGFDAVISLGGDMGAYDDADAPWLPATRRLLAHAVADRTPTLGICLGAQLLAAAGGGIVTAGMNGPERGAYLTARRDAAEHDPLFSELPLTPDVMHYHDDVVSVLPPGATLLLSSPGYPHQAWRQGDAAWAVQFHIETGADDLRKWASHDDLPMTGRFGPMLDDAAETMALVWRDVAARFVGLAATRAQRR